MGLSVTLPANPPAGAEEPFTVQVETLSWVHSLVDGPQEGSRFFQEEARPGDRVRDVLRRLSDRYPKLAEALWDPATGEIGSHIEIIVNDTILGVSYELDSPVNPGDTILLAGQYIGG